jgi:hypothetical protein
VSVTDYGRFVLVANHRHQTKTYQPAGRRKDTAEGKWAFVMVKLPLNQWQKNRQLWVHSKEGSTVLVMPPKLPDKANQVFRLTTEGGFYV